MTESAKPDQVDCVTAYARDVVAGHVLAGRLVRLACQRHLDDLELGQARGLTFNAVEAQAAIDFWETCPHLKGRKFAGKPIRLEPWQRFIIGSIYGWKKAGGRRRFRIAWIELARKNGKSTMLYPAALHGLVLDDEAGAEVYSIATKRDQARLIFELAKRAVGQSRDLSELITPYVYTLINEKEFGKFEAISADAHTLDGLNPSVALCDEIHKWRGRSLWDVIETAMGARDQPLMLAITTAGEEGDQDVYGQEHNHTQQVLEGVIQDDSRFGYIACLDPEDDWTDPKNFAKANPNLGVSVDPDELADAVRKAKHVPASASTVKRLRLGIRSQDADAWIPLTLWDRAKDDRLSWESLAGFPCFAGLDLANSSDFAALALAFPLTADLQPAEDEQRPDLWGYVFRLWMPREGRDHRGQKLREIATPWVEAGRVVITEGDTIDGDFIEADVIEASKRFTLRGLAYDPFNAGTMANHLQQEGIDVAQFPQRLSLFSEPVRLFEAELLSGHMRHDGNPAMRWMADNVMLIGNAAGHRMPSRKKSKNKIDGMVAALMARGRAMQGDSAASYYDTHGVERI